jgi:hypothetical protein
LAAQLDALLVACEDRLALLYPGGRSWFLFDTQGLPQQQIPPTGAVYVLSDDADRVLVPPPGATGNPDGGGPWPGTYDHAAMTAATAALTVVGLGPGDASWFVDPAGTVPVDVYTPTDSLAVMMRTHTDPVAGTLTLPVLYQGEPEPERFYRYALADVFAESATPKTYPFPYDKYGCVRFHNLGLATASFDLGDGLPVVVPPDGVVVIRRTGRTEVWSSAMGNLRRYFPGCLPLDVPVWDGQPAASAARPARSQYANPVFRVALLQSMFRPQALTDGPGMFTAEVVDVLPPVAPTARVSKSLVQEGTFDVVRSPPQDVAGDTTLHTLTYAGEDLTTTPPAWAEIGLIASVDPAHRGAHLVYDPSFPGPGGGAFPWHFDFLLGTTNLVGAVVAREGIVLPWFRVLTGDAASDAAADAWAQALFAWPTYAVVRDVGQHYYRVAHWEPLVPFAGTLNPDYCGSWVEDELIVTRQYTADWGSVGASTLPPWNVFTSQITDLLPAGEGQSDVALKRNPIFLAVTLQQTVEWHAPREDATWDDATSIRPKPPGPGPGRFLLPPRQPAARAVPRFRVDDAWREPLFQIGMLPTLGHDAQELAGLGCTAPNP